jgi:hypothetical protein
MQKIIALNFTRKEAFFKIEALSRRGELQLSEKRF